LITLYLPYILVQKIT